MLWDFFHLSSPQEPGACEVFRHFRVDAAWPAGSSPAFKKIHPYPVVSVKDPLQSCQQFQGCARLHSNSKTTSDSIFGHFALCPKVAKHFSATVSTAISCGPPVNMPRYRAAACSMSFLASRSCHHPCPEGTKKNAEVTHCISKLKTGRTAIMSNA